MIKTGSLFTQVLSLVNRNDFARAVRQWDAEKGAKGFRCWDQFVSMVFCQLAGADSLREICGGLSTAMGKLTHVGLKQAPSRSTLAYANQHRPWQLFESVFYALLGQAETLANQKKRRFRFKNPLFSIDASTIDLCLSLYDWATFRRKKGDFAASTIGRIYKDRWQIELFFKAIKQNLKIKTFVGTSENAVKVQIWTALLCMLVLKILQMRSTFDWSLSNLAAMLRFNLLTYRDLWVWLNQPYQTPALGPPDGQLLLFG